MLGFISIKYLRVLKLLSLLFLGFVDISLNAYTISGYITDNETSKPIIGTSIALIPLGKIAVSDKYGYYEFNEIPSGKYALYVSLTGYKIMKKGVEIGDNDKKENIRLIKDALVMPEIIVKGKREKSTVSRETINKEEIKHIAGTSGDVLKIVQNLPGIASGNEFTGQLYIRGGDDNDNRIFFDNMRIYNPFHFGGLTSVFNSDLVRRLDIYTGCYPTEFYDVSGGVIDIETRKIEKTPAGFRIHTTAMMSEAIVEGPIGPLKYENYFILAGRISYIGLLFGNLLPNLTAIPVFGDYQAKFGFKLYKDMLLNATFIGAFDHLDIKMSLDDEDTKEELEAANKYQFHSGGISYRWRIKKRAIINSFVNIYYYSNHINFARIVDIDTAPLITTVKLKGKLFANKVLSLNLGLAYEFEKYTMKGSVPDFEEMLSQSTNTITTNSQVTNTGTSAMLERLLNMPTIEINEYELKHDLTLFTEGKIKFKYFNFISGINYQYSFSIKKYAIGFRFSAQLTPTKNTIISFSFGKSDQRPPGFQASKKFGNSDLDFSHTYQGVIGFQQFLPLDFYIKSEVYLKDSRDLVVVGDENYSNDGRGLTFGVETIIRRNFGKRFYGWISYTFSRSVRRDEIINQVFYSIRDIYDNLILKNDWYLFDYDQTHMVSFIFNIKITKNWIAGFKWRLSTGVPIDEIIDTLKLPVVDENGIPITDDNGNPEYTYKPVYGEINGDRLPLYHKLDLRIERKLKFGRLNGFIFFELLNAYSWINLINSNWYNTAQMRRIDSSTGEITYINGLPIMGNFGIELSF